MNIGLKKEIQKVNNNLKLSFKKIKQELNSYLDTINQNTNEIQSNYEFLIEIDKKIETFSDRLDELTMMINPKAAFNNYKFDLSLREQEVFLVMYAINKKMSADAIAKRLGLTLDKTNVYLYGLINKKVPLNKEYHNGRLFFFLDESFRALQARQNIIKIDSSVSKQLLSDDAI
jgi:DNA-binding CsgD family transcriptional regulator